MEIIIQMKLLGMRLMFKIDLIVWKFSSAKASHLLRGRLK